MGGDAREGVAGGGAGGLRPPLPCFKVKSKSNVRTPIGLAILLELQREVALSTLFLPAAARRKHRPR